MTGTSIGRYISFVVNIIIGNVIDFSLRQKVSYLYFTVAMLNVP